MRSAEAIVVYSSEKLGGWTAVYFRESTDGKLAEVLSVTHPGDGSQLLTGIRHLFPKVTLVVIPGANGEYPRHPQPR